ncbi:uncharacterized protein EMH_0013030 [Eimeria mitis]|uniref:Transmembrane protein n=1 Tax=Eimeria mitis TaxID=44415 RepID=U6JVP9_9EIME|nr:uncharacterized protein EMH_0013030 [Eimeria mitis]CDJ28137.1 hypothetical protein, conserved [Eimeria mitis]
MKESKSCNSSDSDSCHCSRYCCHTAPDFEASCSNLTRSTSTSTTCSGTIASSISRECSKGSRSGSLHQEEEIEEFIFSRSGSTEERSSSSTGGGEDRNGGRARRIKGVFSSVLSHYWAVGASFRWGRRRSSTIGVSCLFYLLPCFALPFSSSSSSISARRELESYMWSLVAVASFLSDFVFSGQRHHWGVRAVHMTDRWLASFALMLQCLYNLPLWFSVSFYVGNLGLIFVLCCCALKARSTFASSYEEYVWTHTAWHVAGAAARCVMAFLEGH